MNQNTIKLKIADILRNDFGFSIDNTEDLSNIDIVENVLFTSISFVSFIIELETEFEILIPDNFFAPDNFKKIENIVDMVYRLIQEKNNEKKC